MRSQLCTLEKLDIGRVRRRTSRKARSITLVVRTLIQCAGGTAKKFSRASRSRSTPATALGRRCCQCCFQSRKARWGCAFTAGAIHGGGSGHTGSFSARDFVGDVSEFVCPATLHRHVGENERQSGLQAFAAVADDQLQSLTFQAAKKKILQELLPGGLAFVLGELVGQHATQPGARHSISD